MEFGMVGAEIINIRVQSNHTFKMVTWLSPSVFHKFYFYCYVTKSPLVLKPRTITHNFWFKVIQWFRKKYLLFHAIPTPDSQSFRSDTWGS